MSHVTEATTQAAKKPYRCSWCWQGIAVGEQYTRYRFFDGGDAGTVRAHPECYGAIQDLAREEGGWCEWTPGMERPSKEPA
jgi:hypothetical protein